MLIQIKNLIFAFLLIFSLTAQSWNATGHRLIAQIAYDNLPNNVKEYYLDINNSLDVVYPHVNWQDSAVWMDNLKWKHGVAWFNTAHYKNNFFSIDGTALPPENPINSVWAINTAMKMIMDNHTVKFNKGIAFRVLIHVIGDIHQPMHAASMVSINYPKGDLGGNLFKLGKNDIARNLHAYWDKGAGIFANKTLNNETNLLKFAKKLENEWPCKLDEDSLNPEDWDLQSNQIAKKIAYNIQPYAKPSQQYQDKAQKICLQQISKAGCNLAQVLIDLYNMNKNMQ